jgi:hypothetical protein
MSATTLTEPKPIDVNSPVGQSLVKSQGRLEAGSIFNPLGSRIPSETIHVRIHGEGATLCGQKLRTSPEAELRWVWYSFGKFGERLPAYSDGKNHYKACSRCAAHPVYQITKTIAEQKQKLLFSVAN